MPYKTVERYPRVAGIPDQVTRFFEIPSLDEYRNVSVTWAVEGLIPRGSLTFLIAPPGGYKTWFALALAGAVSQGAATALSRSERNAMIWPHPVWTSCLSLSTHHLC